MSLFMLCFFRAHFLMMIFYHFSVLACLDLLTSFIMFLVVFFLVRFSYRFFFFASLSRQQSISHQLNDLGFTI